MTPSNKKSGEDSLVPGVFYNLGDNKEIQLKPVKVIAEKATGNLVIPDYDIAMIGLKEEPSNVFLLDEKRGGVPKNEDLLLNELIEKVDSMIHHAADNYNPTGYKFEMTEDAPYTVFLPDKQNSIINIHNQDEYINFLNKYRKEGYYLLPNPKTGIKIDKDGILYMPKANDKIDWEQRGEYIEKLYNMQKLADELNEVSSNKQEEHLVDSINKGKFFNFMGLLEEFADRPDCNIEDINKAKTILVAIQNNITTKKPDIENFLRL